MYNIKHWRIVRSSFLYVLIITTISAAHCQTALPPSNKPTYLHMIDPLGITQAIKDGDSDKTNALAESAIPSMMKTYALAGYYRTIFKIHQSTQYAQQCYDAALRQLPRAVVEAIHCGELLAGNYAILGRTSDWARTMQDTRDDLYSVAIDSLHDTDIVFPGFGTISHHIDMSKFYTFPDETVTGNTRQNITIPRVLDSGEKSYPNSFKTGICQLGIRCFGKYLYYINVTINGKNVVAAIDTGSDINIVPTSEKYNFDVHYATTPYYPFSFDKDQSTQMHDNLGYINTIRIATTNGKHIVLKNSNVRVGGKMAHNIGIVLGLNAISRLGTVLFEMNKMIVNPDLPSMQCDKPLHIGSINLFSGYTIFFEEFINGAQQDVMLDTGENQYLFGTSIARIERSSSQKMATESERVTGNMKDVYYPSKVEFGSGTRAKDMTIAVFPGDEQGYPYVAGSDILQDYDVFLDFKGERACLIPTS